MRPVWVFDAADRLSALVDRNREMECYLQRSLCDVPRHSLAWDRLQARLSVVRRRVRCLCQRRRAARRTAYSAA